MSAAGGDPPRLRPEMASMRLLVLGFVRDYIVRHGGSPSYGEIAHGLSSNRERVRKAVKRLVATGLLLRRPGPRGLMLPERIDEAAALLRQFGAPGPAMTPMTQCPLPERWRLDYIPADGEAHGETGQGGQDAGGEGAGPADQNA